MRQAAQTASASLQRCCRYCPARIGVSFISVSRDHQSHHTGMCRRIASPLLILLLLGLSSHAPCLGAPQPANHGSILGSVRAPSGIPIHYAIITVLNTPFGAVTDDSGHYRIATVPIGTYDLRATSMGRHDSTVHGAVVTADSATSVDFVLKDLCVKGHLLPLGVSRAIEAATSIELFSPGRDMASPSRRTRVASVEHGDLIRALLTRIDTDSCCANWDCLFMPRYGVRFISPSDTLRLVVGSDCLQLRFHHHGENLRSCDPMGAWEGEIRAVMTRLFPDSLSP